MSTSQTLATRDYNLFHFMRGNRKIRKAHVRQLQESHSRHPELGADKPVLVNDKMEIGDGQHTFLARKNLALPIYYRVVNGLDLTVVQELNSQAKTWTPVDYAESYTDLGSEVYEFYLQLRQQYGYNHDILMAFVSLESPITANLFRDGKLQSPDRERTQLYCQQLAETGKYYHRYNIRPFALALLSIMQSPAYDHQRMMGKLALRGKFIKDLSLREDYIRELEKVYNWKTSQANKVRFNYN